MYYQLTLPFADMKDTIGNGHNHDHCRSILHDTKYKENTKYRVRKYTPQPACVHYQKKTGAQSVVESGGTSAINNSSRSNYTQIRCM